MADGSIQVIIADDHPLVRTGLKYGIGDDAGIEIVDVTSNPDDLYRLLSHGRCDVVVADYAMPGTNVLDGWPLMASLSRHFPGTRILVYSCFEEPFLIGTLNQLKIDGLVSKREPLSQVLEAIKNIASGTRYLSPLILAALDEFFRDPGLRHFPQLDHPETEAAGLLLSGLSAKHSALVVGEAVEAMSQRRYSAVRKLGFSNEEDLYAYAEENALLLNRSSADCTPRL